MRKLAKYAILFCLACSIASACTIAVFAPEATETGKPMLWKNRDVSNANQQYIYVEDGLSFIGVTYQGHADKIYSGVNSEGFGIINSDTYNSGGASFTGLVDGRVMYLALSRCTSIWDFAFLLDSLINDTTAGLRSTHCYAVIDKNGNAGVFENTCTSFAYFSANAAPQKFLVRANFAISGASEPRRGYDRYMRARALLEPLLPITVPELAEVASNLVSDALDPLPLPFEGELSELPFGYISTENTINRFITTSSQFIEGMSPTSYEPHYPVLWGGFGQPYCSIIIPMFLNAHGLPSEITGDGNIMCSESRFVTSSLYDIGLPHAFNTYAASRIHDFFMPTQTYIFETFFSYSGAWEKTLPTSSDLSAVQNELTNYVANSYSNLHSLLVRESEHNSPQTISVRAYPSPFNAQVTLEISIPRGSWADFVISDISGKTFDRTRLGWGNHLRSWAPNPDAPAGLYFATVLCGTSRTTAKLIYVK